MLAIGVVGCGCVEGPQPLPSRIHSHILTRSCTCIQGLDPVGLDALEWVSCGSDPTWLPYGDLLNPPESRRHYSHLTAEKRYMRCPCPSHPSTPHPIISHHTPSHPITVHPHPITPHPITPHPIPSHFPSHPTSHPIYIQSHPTEQHCIPPRRTPHLTHPTASHRLPPPPTTSHHLPPPSLSQSGR